MYRTFTAILVIILLGCKENESSLNTELLLGNWRIYSSEINNKTSRNLDNAFFEFAKNNKVHSNIFDDGNSHNYTLNSDILSIDSPEPIKLTIKKLTKDTLFMEGKLRVFYMKFFLEKMPDM
ncbi:MAG: hypothetical protein IPM42_20175 [Saprospiraceae bacterium]|nr:hypothetical protein [Saprospiraceae bacterium]